MRHLFIALLWFLTWPSQNVHAAEAPTKPKAWIGVALSLQPPKDLKPFQSTPFPQGCALIENVIAGTPGEDAGLRPDDMICSVNGDPTPTAKILIAAIKKFDVGTAVTLKVLRAQKIESFKMALAPRPGDSEEYLRKVLVGKPTAKITLDHWVGEPSAAKGELLGQVTLIDFWEPWCGPCKAAVPWLNMMHEKYGNKGLQVIGITSEPEGDPAVGKKELGITYPVAWDPKGHARAKFMILAFPTLLVIDKKGILVDVHVGLGDSRATQLQIEELLRAK